MNTENQRLLVDQVDKKMRALARMESYSFTSEGWINTLRTALHMSLRQLAMRMSVTPQNVKNLEQSEKEGSISIRKLKEIAEVLDMKLVYAFVPKAGSLRKLIEEKATQKAKEIVTRTSHTMALEDQNISNSRIKDAIREKTETIIREMPKYLWD